MLLLFYIEGSETMNLNGRASIRDCIIDEETLTEFIIHHKIIRMDILVRYITRLRGKSSMSSSFIAKYLQSPNAKGYEVVSIVTSEGMKRSAQSKDLSSLYLASDYDISSSLDKLKKERASRLIIQEIMDECNYTPIEIEYTNTDHIMGVFHFFESPKDIMKMMETKQNNSETVIKEFKKDSIFITPLNFPEESIQKLMESYSIRTLIIPINAGKNGKNYLKDDLTTLNVMYYDMEYKELLKNCAELEYYIT